MQVDKVNSVTWLAQTWLLYLWSLEVEKYASEVSLGATGRDGEHKETVPSNIIALPCNKVVLVRCVSWTMSSGNEVEPSRIESQWMEVTQQASWIHLEVNLFPTHSSWNKGSLSLLVETV